MAADPSQVCHECKRGSSNPGDEIMFCEMCHTPYHRLCHHPAIDRIFVEVPEAQWFCHECQAKRANSSGDPPLETGQPPVNFEPEVRKAYLSLLPKSLLIQLIQYAEKLHPDLPLYPPHAVQIVERAQEENQEFKRLQYHARPGGYEDLMVRIITENAGEQGVDLQNIWKAVANEKGNLDAAFKHSASRALQRVLRKGRVSENQGKFTPNVDYQPSSDMLLTQLLKADDQVMFDSMPLRIAPPDDELPLQSGDVFTYHKWNDPQPT